MSESKRPVDKGESDSGDRTTIRYLAPGDLSLSRSAGGFLQATVDGRELPRVFVHQAFPLSMPNEYISVRDDEQKEIGIIRRLDEMDQTVQELIESELSRRYFAPIVEKVNSLKEEFGYLYWDVMTSSGDRRFTQQAKPETILGAGDQELIVIDIDENRFRLPRYRTLLGRFARTLDPIL